MPEPQLIQDARALSSGTLSYLVDDTRYTVIDQARADFVEYCEENQHIHRHETWVQVWHAFINVYDLEKVKKSAGQLSAP
jgi:hypothetical protein